MEEFSIETASQDSDEFAVIRPVGNINTTTVPVLQSRLDALAKKERYKIVVDLSKTTFISSSGIGVFIGTVSTLRKHGGDLILMKIPELIKNVFDLLNLKDHFRMIESMDELKEGSKS